MSPVEGKLCSTKEWSTKAIIKIMQTLPQTFSLVCSSCHLPGGLGLSRRAQNRQQTVILMIHG